MRKVSLRDIIKPRKIEVEDETPDHRYGKFVVEPLERGYGVTLGNSLRRVLLSSIEGAAITSLRIDGVMHEFSTIPGVREDVTKIVLNLKEVVVILQDKDQAVLRVEAEGPCTVKAGMLTGDPAVKIVNPDLVIATLEDGAKFSMEVTVRVGRGYEQADAHKLEGAPVGTIFIDSIFSPVRKVNFLVTSSRVGQRTDYDKLTLEVWTDGSIDVRSAIAEASHVLTEQLKPFVGEGIITEREERVEEVKKEEFNENLFRRVEELDLSVRSANCLENADIKYIGELVQKTEAEMLRTKNFGRKSLNEIKEELGKLGLDLGMKLENFPDREELDRLYEERIKR
ncbi:MAG: DNA-directed RNA polymerase subunit alpha [Candidatus Dadabacteria bacterium]|nr:MAG: DNA-directed RNA polymerase subunit alpha [Candidatus Dadabacteria bacterium]